MEMNYVGIRFSESDEELQQAIREKFPDCRIIHSNELEGAEVFFVAILPLAGFGLQLLDFIMTHFANKNSDGKNAGAQKREIVVDGKAVEKAELEKKSEDEVKRALKVKLKLDFEVSMGE